MLPVRDVGLDQSGEVVEDALERLGRRGRGSGERRPHRAGLDLREHGIALEAVEIVGDAIGHAMRARTKLRRRHVRHRSSVARKL
jgi:hypothetical protein